MVKAVSFLLNSVYWLEKKKSDWFNDYSDTDRLSIEFGLNQELLIRDDSSTHIALSYSSRKEGFKKGRGERFFEEVFFDKKEWIAAVKIALSEYFTILLYVAENNPDNDTSRVMLTYYDVWKEVSGD
jgi:hypothetical protein